jgi:hypothetical protein
MIVDVGAWAKRNIYRQPSGSLAVRPALRRLLKPAAGRKFVAGFSVVNQWTLDVWHYVADVGVDDTNLLVRVFDEDFSEFQAFDTGVDARPRGFSHGLVEGELMIGGDNMPTLWGLVGSGLTFATAVPSDNPNTTAIPVPRGIVGSCLNRIIIGSGNSLFVSDPVAVTGGSPRTFVAANQNNRPGVVFGIHEGANGNLVVVTSAGVYSLDPSAFAVQVVGSNGTDWRLVNHAEAFSYDSSCNVRGRIYGLTQRGMALIDVEGDAEVFLDDPMTPRRFGPRVSELDWRAARIYASDTGPLVASRALVNVGDVASGLRSWWDCKVELASSSVQSFAVVGTLRDLDGSTMVLSEDGIYAVGGNMDGEQLLSTTVGGANQPRGVLVGIVPTGPDDNTTIRQMQFSAALGGSTEGTIEGAVRGAPGIAFPSSTPPADTRSLIVDTSSWGASGVVYQPTPMQTVRMDLNYNSDDVAIEITANLPDTRIGPLMVVNPSDSAPKRTVHRGPP